MGCAAILFLASAPAAATVGDGACEKEVTFLGFSADESMAAWRIEVTRMDPAGRYLDRYEVVQLVDTQTDLTLATYRTSPIRRTTENGRDVRMPASYLAAANPTWASAEPAKAWYALANTARFDASPVGRAARIEVEADPGVALSRHDRDDAVELRADSPMSAALLTGSEQVLGYVVRLSRGPGSSTVLGRFRHEGPAGSTVDGRLQVLRSASGRHVAVLNRFEVHGASGARSLSFGKIVDVSAKAPALAGSAPRGRAPGGWQTIDAPASAPATFAAQSALAFEADVDAGVDMANDHLAAQSLELAERLHAGAENGAW